MCYQDACLPSWLCSLPQHLLPVLSFNESLSTVATNTVLSNPTPPPRRLTLTIPRLGAGLPDVAAGALPQLRTLHLLAAEQPTTLPASWGSRPDVLPELSDLSLTLGICGTLPASWAAGFSHLAMLVLGRHTPLGQTRSLCAGGSSGSATAGGTAERPRLPPEWGTGFPRLSALNLADLGLVGTIPLEWQEGGFPALTDL